MFPGKAVKARGGGFGSQALGSAKVNNERRTTPARARHGGDEGAA